MKRFFNDENPIMNVLSWMSDMIVLNVITILGCLPIITAGASLTAAHYAALKVKRCEGSVPKNFWKSFRENLKQSTVLWVLFLSIITVNYLAFIALSTGEGNFPLTLQGMIIASSLFSICTMLWILPLQSKFTNTVFKTVRLAFLLNIKYILRTLAMLILTVLPFLISLELFSIFLLFGLSVPIYLCSVCYDKLFCGFEKDILENPTDSAEKAVVEK